MDRLKQAAVLTHLIKRMRDEGSWCGETHIQKCVYFLQELTAVDFGFKFVLYRHGPFSFDLRAELTGLRADHLVKLEVVRPYGAKFYTTAQSDRIRSRFPRTLERFEKQIEFVVERLARQGIWDLERIATAYFIKCRHPEFESVDSIAKELVRLKPHVSLENAIKAVKTADRFCGEWQ